MRGKDLGFGVQSLEFRVGFGVWGSGFRGQVKECSGVCRTARGAMLR